MERQRPYSRITVFDGSIAPAMEVNHGPGPADTVPDPPAVFLPPPPYDPTIGLTTDGPGEAGSW